MLGKTEMGMGDNGNGNDSMGMKRDGNSKSHSRTPVRPISILLINQRSVGKSA